MPRTLTTSTNYTSFADLVSGEKNNRSVFLTAFEKLVRNAMRASDDPELREGAESLDIRDIMAQHCAARKWVLTSRTIVGHKGEFDIEAADFKFFKEEYFTDQQLYANFGFHIQDNAENGTRLVEPVYIIDEKVAHTLAQNGETGERIRGRINKLFDTMNHDWFHGLFYDMPDPFARMVNQTANSESTFLTIHGSAMETLELPDELGSGLIN